MFNCGFCYQPSKPKEKPITVVVQTRLVVYPEREKAHSNGNDDPGGKGWEIVREVLVHKSCV